MKIKAESVQRTVVRIAAASAASPVPTSRELPDKTTSAWLTVVSSCLTQEVAAHPRCAGCKILMGPGHLEGGNEPLCGTCLVSKLARMPDDDPEARRRIYGRRGWHSDYLAEQSGPAKDR